MNIVADTNVLVAGLLTPFGVCSEIVRMISSGELTLSFDARILTEYSEVLRRQKFGFEEEKIAALLDYIVDQGHSVAPSPLIDSLPDADDEPFLEVALAGQSKCLVTGNQKHFSAALCQGARVFSPKDFLIFYKKQRAAMKRTKKRPGHSLRQKR